MKYLAAAFLFTLWLCVTVVAIVTVIGILILAGFDEDLTEYWFNKIPQSILEVFKK